MRDSNIPGSSWIKKGKDVYRKAIKGRKKEAEAEAERQKLKEKLSIVNSHKRTLNTIVRSKVPRVSGRDDQRTLGLIQRPVGKPVGKPVAPQRQQEAQSHRRTG